MAKDVTLSDIAEAILGLFSLDLTKPLELTVHAGESEDLSELLDALKPYIVA